ncbi:MAG: 16S rRNA (guanine(527)-N(7))-methyltransferase RsmG [Actinobacteria bacterium]|nr:MAG: 16S rRNA (guanine(527)-N(7))-methyltransferase RsmG [Actinomycetota bacterium]
MRNEEKKKKMMLIEKEGIRTVLREAIGRAASKMGLDIDEEKLECVIAYAIELQKWNKAYNLVGRKTGVEGFVDLFVDAVTPMMLRNLFDEGKEVLDVGSGAGLPGIPLYLIAGPFALTLVESQRKKITFLRHICRTLDLHDVRVYPGRIEDMTREEDHLNAYEIALARAVMDPLRLLRVARPLLCEAGQIVAFVGKGDAERIRRSALDLEVGGVKLEAVRSTQRIVGKENYLAVFRKTGR